MTELERIKLLIKKGYTYDAETGKIYGARFPEKEVVSKNNNGYIRLSVVVDKKEYCVVGHRFAWYYHYGKLPENMLDHFNNNKSDNRLLNLREVNNQQNLFNTKAKGFYRKGNKWYSMITLNYETLYLGSFNTEEDARQAYLDAKKIYHKID